MANKRFRLREWIFDKLHGPPIWAAVVLIALISTIVWTYHTHADAISTNQKLIAQLKAADQRSKNAIEYLCEMTGTLDVLVVQFASSGRKTLRTLRGEPRREFRKQLMALDTAHHVLSKTRACREVTG